MPHSPNTSPRSTVHLDTDAILHGCSRLVGTARSADQLSVDVRRSLARADLAGTYTMGTVRSLGELEEELDLLARTLRRRAATASGFRISVDRLEPDRGLELWRSLTDNSGAPALISGDTALLLLLERGPLQGRDGESEFTFDDVRSWATGPPGPIRSAAQAIVGTPMLFTLLVEEERAARPFEGAAGRFGDHTVQVETVRAFLAENERIRRLAPPAAAALASGTSSILADGIELDAVDIVVAAINRQVHAGDRAAAREFIARLPNPTTGVAGLPIMRIDPDGQAELHRTATIGLAEDDLRGHFEIVSQLPESASGFRNEKITALYAATAVALSGLVNPDQPKDPTTPNHAGATWLHWGAPASFAVGAAIRGEVTSFGFTIPDVARQHMADGNQLIATDVIGRYIDLVDTFDDGVVSRAKIISFLGEFGDGEAELRAAFALQLAAFTETDPARRQQLQLQSNILVGTHEQAVVDRLLDFNALPAAAQIGAYVLSGTGALLGRGTFDSRSASELATDDGELVLPGPGGPIRTFALSEPILDGPNHNSLVEIPDLRGAANPAAIDELDLGLPGADSLPTITSVGVPTGLSVDATDWARVHPRVGADDWTRYEHRMQYLPPLMTEHHVDPALFETAAHLAPGLSGGSM